MGLREMHAAQTRELILDAAFSLFLERGYERTKMEDIAGNAGVGTTTLYRYYPSKDLLITGPLELRGQMADMLRSRPADEPLDVALGHAVTALAVTPRADAARMAQIMQVLEATPTLGTRLYEELVRERIMLQHAIADRLKRPADDLFCIATAHTTTMVVELAALSATVAESDQGAPAATRIAVESMLRRLAAEPPVLPRLE